MGVTIRQVLSSLLDDTDKVYIINNDTHDCEFFGIKTRIFETVPKDVLDSFVEKMYYDPTLGNVIYREAKK